MTMASATTEEVGPTAAVAVVLRPVFVGVELLAPRVELPLRDRLSDVPALVDQFLTGICSRFGIRKKRIASGALDLLMAYPWRRNNVRAGSNSAVISRPSYSTVPSSAWSIPLMTFRRVDFPEPLRPTTATAAPFSMRASA